MFTESFVTYCTCCITSRTPAPGPRPPARRAGDGLSTWHCLARCDWDIAPDNGLLFEVSVELVAARTVGGGGSGTHNT